MKSTFKKEYEKKILPDATVELIFKEGRLGAINGAALSGLFTLVLLVVVFWVWLLIAAGIAMVIGERHMAIAMGMSIIPTLLICAYAVRKLAVKTSTIAIKKEGIIFDRKGWHVFKSGRNVLLFSDISEMGIMEETAAPHVVIKSSYIFALAHGKEIAVTRHMNHALAKALLDEMGLAAASFQ